MGNILCPHRIWTKAITFAIVCAFVFNDTAYTLADPFHPRQDQEHKLSAESSFKHGITKFQEVVIVAYLKKEMSEIFSRFEKKAYNLDFLKGQIKRNIFFAGLTIDYTRFRVDELYRASDGAFCLPYTSVNGQKLVLRFVPSPVKKSAVRSAEGQTGDVRMPAAAGRSSEGISAQEEQRPEEQVPQNPGPQPKPKLGPRIPVIAGPVITHIIYPALTGNFPPGWVTAVVLLVTVISILPVLMAVDPFKGYSIAFSAKLPPDSIGGLYKWFYYSHITTPETALTAEEVFKNVLSHLDRAELDLKCDFNTLESSLMALDRHLHLIEKVEADEAGKPPRYYIPESRKDYAGGHSIIMYIFDQFNYKFETTLEFRTDAEFLDELYNDIIAPMMRNRERMEMIRSLVVPRALYSKQMGIDYERLRDMGREFHLPANGTRGNSQNMLNIILGGYILPGRDSREEFVMVFHSCPLKEAFGPSYVLLKSPLPEDPFLPLSEKYHLMYLVPENELEYMHTGLRLAVERSLISEEEARKKAEKIITHARLLEVLEGVRDYCDKRSKSDPVTFGEIASIARSYNIPFEFVKQLLVNKGFTPAAADEEGGAAGRSHAPDFPPGSIGSVFKWFCDNDITTPEAAVTGERIAESLSRAWSTIDPDIRALYYHLHLIEKVDAGETGKAARYYVSPPAKLYIWSISEYVLGQFKGKDLRPKAELLDEVYRTRIVPILLEARRQEMIGSLPRRVIRNHALKIDYERLRELGLEFDLYVNGTRQDAANMLNIMLGGYIRPGADSRHEFMEVFYSRSFKEAFGPFHVVLKSPLPADMSNPLFAEYHQLYVVPEEALEYIHSGLRLAVTEGYFTEKEARIVAAKVITHKRLIEVLESMKKYLAERREGTAVKMTEIRELASLCNVPADFMLQLFVNKGATITVDERGTVTGGSTQTVVGNPVSDSPGFPGNMATAVDAERAAARRRTERPETFQDILALVDDEHVKKFILVLMDLAAESYYDKRKKAIAVDLEMFPPELRTKVKPLLDEVKRFLAKSEGMQDLPFIIGNGDELTKDILKLKENYPNEGLDVILLGKPENIQQRAFSALGSVPVDEMRTCLIGVSQTRFGAVPAAGKENYLDILLMIEGAIKLFSYSQRNVRLSPALVDRFKREYPSLGFSISDEGYFLFVPDAESLEVGKTVERYSAQKKALERSV